MTKKKRKYHRGAATHSLAAGDRPELLTPLISPHPTRKISIPECTA
jgi:hypothetical protein